MVHFESLKSESICKLVPYPYDLPGGAKTRANTWRILARLI